jgi:acetyltransferase EpsM
MSERRPLVVIGGGEHARVVLEAVRSRPEVFEVLGYVDRAPTAIADARWLGTDDDFAPGGDWKDTLLVLGIGWSAAAAREEVVRRYDARGATWATVVHAWARVSPRAVLADGAVVLAGAIVNGGASLGAHCVVNTGVVIEHDVRLGRNAHAAPGAVLGGGVDVGDHAFLGLGCRIRDHVRIGSRAVVAMGATVVGSVPDGVTVMGTPARPVNMNDADA